MKKCKIVCFKNKKGKYQWHGVWANGEIGFHSEAYTVKHGCYKSARKVSKLIGWKLQEEKSAK
jgi:uncharacterized protein YegP (UPF0339 family)